VEPFKKTLAYPMVDKIIYFIFVLFIVKNPVAKGGLSQKADSDFSLLLVL